MKKRGDANDIPSAYGGDERGLTPRGEAALALEARRVGFTPDRLGEIPNGPGVYLMRDARGDVIYVGKSVALRTRVRNYFAEGGDGRLAAQFLQRKIATVDIVATRSEKEALLLENAFIKQYNPRYNFRLTDDKSYYSIKLDTRKQFPRLEFVRTRNVPPSPGAGVEYFGPFHSSEAVKATISFLQKVFPLRTCTDHVLRNRARPCILHEIGKCCAPCVLPVSEAAYGELLEGTRLFLTGKGEAIVRRLRATMAAHSAALEFEAAARVRDQLHAIERTLEAQTVAQVSRTTRDVIALARQAATVCFVVLHYGERGLAETEHFVERDLGDDDDELMHQFVTQYYGAWREAPGEVWTSHAPRLAAEVEEFLRGRQDPDARRQTRLATPQRGDKARVVELALLNARQMLERELAGRRSREDVLDSLRAKLGLPRPPRHIECFDISTFQGAHNVAAMVCFRDGEPDKSSYRRFKMRTVAAGQADDFASMRETLTRRYRRVLDEGGDLPDLVLIDGGKGQLGMALEVLRELGLAGEVPVAALAKSRLKEAGAAGGGAAEKMRTEERVFLPGRKNPVLFRRDAPALFLLQRIRDETHRFVIAFHRDQRRKGGLRSSLDYVPGIGPTRRRALLRHFGSLTAVRAASVEHLAAAPKMTRAAAEALFAALRNEDARSA